MGDLPATLRCPHCASREGDVARTRFRTACCGWVSFTGTCLLFEHEQGSKSDHGGRRINISKVSIHLILRYVSLPTTSQIFGHREMIAAQASLYFSGRLLCLPVERPGCLGCVRFGAGSLECVGSRIHRWSTRVRRIPFRHRDVQVQKHSWKAAQGPRWRWLRVSAHCGSRD